MATSTIFITQRDNDRFFNQKLPTWRNGFCRIKRLVTKASDPYEIWDFYGTINTPCGKVIVVSNDGAEWEIQQ